MPNYPFKDLSLGPRADFQLGYRISAKSRKRDDNKRAESNLLSDEIHRSPPLEPVVIHLYIY